MLLGLLVLTLVQDTAPIAVIPQPVSLTRAAGRFTLTPATVIWTDRASAHLGRQLALDLEPATGFPLDVQVGGTPGGRRIVLRRDTTLRPPEAKGWPGRISRARLSTTCCAVSGEPS